MTDPHSHDNSSHNLEDILLRLGDTMHTVTLKLDEILHRVSPVSPSPTPQPSPNPHQPTPAPVTLQKMKFEVLRFDRTEPLGWIFKINQYFEYHGTPKCGRLTIA